MVLVVIFFGFLKYYFVCVNDLFLVIGNIIKLSKMVNYSVVIWIIVVVGSDIFSGMVCIDNRKIMVVLVLLILLGVLVRLLVNVEKVKMVNVI